MTQQRITIRSLNVALMAILENQIALNRKMDQVMSAEDDLTAAVTSMGNVVADAANTILGATQALSIAGQANDTVTIEAQVAKLNALASTLSLANAGLKAIVPAADIPGTQTTTIVTPVSGQTSIPPLSTTEAPPLSTTEASSLSTTSVPPLSSTDAASLSTTEAAFLSTTEAPTLSSTSIPPLSPSAATPGPADAPITGTVNTTTKGSTSSTS